MKRREFIQTAVRFAVGNAVVRDLLPGSQTPPASRLARQKPNIVFVLTETLGIGAVSCYSADNFQTPQIDRLAQGGTRFTHAYTAPLTGPSRVLILTGRYAFRTGATSQEGATRIQPSTETMLPKVLKPAGYATAAVGKWGLPLGPGEFGFDEYLKYEGSGVYWNTQANGETYTVNGEVRRLRDKQYMPDVMHDFLIDFITRHRAGQFYAYYAMSHMRSEILRTPDSAPDSTDFYTDNIRYMDKLIGKLVTELDRLKLRENTLIVFVSDSGTGSVYAGESTVGRRRLSGEKGSMQEGGSLVPLIVNWPGQTPAGKVSADLVDSTDFLPTFAELAGAKLPENFVLDGHSFAARIRGKKGQPREWIFVELAKNWYVREYGWKLNQAGQLFDMKNSPFEEPLVAPDTKDPAAIAARLRLQAVLDKLNPAGGILDEGDGTGRRADRPLHRKKNRQNQ